MSSILPAELRRWSGLQHIRKRGVNEYSAECPSCGDAGHDSSQGPPDRFRMFIDGRPRGWCRKGGCGYFAFADKDDDKPIDPAELERMKAEQKQRQKEQESQQNQRLRAFRHKQEWLVYHDQMTPLQRKKWEKEGICENGQNTYKLGFQKGYRFSYNGEFHESLVMTIPFWGYDWKATNMQRRLLQPPNPSDKYRQTAGLPLSLFLTDPDTPLLGSVLIVEGAKKAMVTYQWLNDLVDMVIVGLPSKYPPLRLLEQLQNCDPWYLALDPDAYTTTQDKNGRLIASTIDRITDYAGNRARLVKLPDKPDDFLLAERSPLKFLHYINHAKRPNTAPIVVSGRTLDRSWFRKESQKAKKYELKYA